MRIDSSSVSMASTRSFREEADLTQASIQRRYSAGGEVEDARVTTSKIRTKALETEGGTSLFHSSSLGLSAEERADGGYKSARAKKEPQSGQPDGQSAAVSVPKPHSDWLSNLSDAIDKDPKIQMLRKCLELLERATGKPVSGNTRVGGRKLSDVLGISVSSVSARYQRTMSLSGGVLELRLDGGSSAGVNGYWTRQTVQSGFVKGEEHTAFTSAGTVVTSDGRTLDFGISVEMSRSYEKAFLSESREEVYTDPLVINLDTDAASLSDVSFYFDLNCDGTEEEISSLNSGSGFLALDKNGDGEINDGSELFGAKTGNGFGELAQYDRDGNGWIDENDDVFSRLSVWTKCGGGEAKLLSLEQAGVGAIFLGSQATQFTLADSSGEENAQVRRTGLYLKENGQAGTVQHLDFKA